MMERKIKYLPNNRATLGHRILLDLPRWLEGVVVEGGTGGEVRVRYHVNQLYHFVCNFAFVSVILRLSFQFF